MALQEVDFFTRRAKHMDLATELELRTGLAPLFGRAMLFDGGEYWEGILSRYSFLSSRNILAAIDVKVLLAGDLNATPDRWRVLELLPADH